MTLVVLVTGDRHWSDRRAVWSTLDRVMPTHLIVGDAKGADFHARTWARYRQLGERLIVFDAEWAVMGRGAGPVRNREMGKRLAAFRLMGMEGRVFAFHDDIDSSRGTADMLEVARGFGFRRTLVRHVPRD
jgi:hypothetical protein